MGHGTDAGCEAPYIIFVANRVILGVDGVVSSLLYMERYSLAWCALVIEVVVLRHIKHKLSQKGEKDYVAGNYSGRQQRLLDISEDKHSMGGAHDAREHRVGMGRDCGCPACLHREICCC